jgi:3-hydroxyacyl-CoA dehydrogenase
MKLLEVVRGSQSSPTAIATAMDIGKRIGKVSVLSGNCYGFIGNRMLHRYVEEAVYMVEEGISNIHMWRLF